MTSAATACLIGCSQTYLEKWSRHTKITEFPALVLGYGPIKSMNNFWPARYVTRCFPMGGWSFFWRSGWSYRTPTILSAHLPPSLANSKTASIWIVICANQQALWLWHDVLSRLNRGAAWRKPRASVIGLHQRRRLGRFRL